MHTLYTKDRIAHADWQQKLTASNTAFETGTEGEYLTIATTDEGAKMIRDKVGIHATMTDEARKKANKTALITFPIILGVCVLLFYAMCGGEPAELSAEEQRRQRFDVTSDFAVTMTMMIKENYVRNPQTYQLEGYRALFHDPDSVTVVMEFSSENDFGVRKQNSLTYVSDNAGRDGRLLTVK
jgi:hypothetical protein